MRLMKSKPTSAGSVTMLMCHSKSTPNASGNPDTQPRSPHRRKEIASAVPWHQRRRQWRARGHGSLSGILQSKSPCRGSPPPDLKSRCGSNSSLRGLSTNPSPGMDTPWPTPLCPRSCPRHRTLPLPAQGRPKWPEHPRTCGSLWATSAPGQTSSSCQSPWPLT